MSCLYVAESKTKSQLTRGVRLWEVSAYKRCPLAEVQLYFLNGKNASNETTSTVSYSQ